jgi:hypothetical protein
LKVFFVNYESQAGWRNSSKQHLLYWWFDMHQFITWCAETLEIRKYSYF